jgi:hypothetical protein
MNRRYLSAFPWKAALMLSWLKNLIRPHHQLVIFMTLEKDLGSA